MMPAAPASAPVQQQPPASSFQEGPKQQESAPATTITIKSPMIGTFYRSPSPGKPLICGNWFDEIEPGKVGLHY